MTFYFLPSRFLLIFLTVFLVALTGCKKQAATAKPISKDTLKVGIVYISNPLDESAGYSFAHHQGIINMQRALGLKDAQILIKENIFESDVAGIESAMRDLIALGARIVFATSWGYMDICEKLSLEYPYVIFAHASGYKSNSTNFTNYFGRIYQARYLSGIVAGLKTKTGKIGYVAAMGKDNSEVTGGINAFALGVEKVNPKARVYVHVTYSWFDPMAEANAARDLIKKGCDVVAQHVDSVNPVIEAEKARVWGIGYNTDMSLDAPKAVITSVLWNWGAYYTSLVKSVIDGTYTSRPYFGSIKDGLVDLSPINMALAAPDTAKVVEDERQRLMQGTVDVFYGELQTNDGKIIGEKGKNLSDDAIRNGINWYYRNVIVN